MRWSATALGLLVGMTPPLSAHAAPKPHQVVPDAQTGKERRATRRARDLSQGGTRDGALELGLGAAVGVVTAAVIGRGIWELTQIDESRRDCLAGASELACTNASSYARGNIIGASLSFGFSVPLGLATGFLFARGARMRRDYRAWHREHAPVSAIHLVPAASRCGGGVALNLRF